MTRPNQKQEPTSPERALDPPQPTPRRWDEVDESSWESFPASDPPPFGGGAKKRRRREDDAKSDE